MTSTALKLLALALMFIDHIAEFIPGIPLWFHWLGRISAPLFMFCMVWGYYYTKDRKKYLLRLYFFGVGMGISGLILNNVVKEPYFPMINNIFVMFLLIGIIVSLIEMRKEDKKRANRYLLYFVLFQVVSTVFCILAERFLPLRYVNNVVGAILPNLIFNEGSFFFVFLGVLMYFNKDTKKEVLLSYGIFCVVYFLICGIGNFNVEWLFKYAYQWMMVGALPFMLLYNRQKGKGFKYLFYFFYPAHIILLFLIGNFLF